MAYRIEGRDIVIDGFDKGIADSPYNGIADMRNMDIISVPPEAAVSLANTPITNIPPVYTNTAFTASASTNRLTVASVAGLYEGCAIALTPTNFTLDVFVLGGGGGGGNGPGGGGGGGGEYLLTEDHVVAIGSYPVTVGAGGATATNGSNSVFDTLTALGGGAGGTGASDGSDGGSGGGGGGDPVGGAGATTDGGTALAAHGEDGGDGTKDPPYYLGGGGGGSAAVGANATSTQGGAGGNASSNSISGSSVAYGGGGGGGGDRDGALAKPSVAAGGTGGGGAGGVASAIDYTAPVAGTANRGGGGGGGTANFGAGGVPQPGAAGGSGVVIISYPTGTINATGGTITTSGGNTIHTFNSNGTFTVSALGTSTLYYVRNIVGSTFQISTAPAGTIYDFTFDTTGTFTTYQYGNQRALNAQAPVAYYIDKSGNLGNPSVNAVYLLDGSNYAWLVASSAIGNIPANSLLFLGNIGGVGASSIPGGGLIIWKGYLELFGAGTANMNLLDLSTFLEDGPAASWNYSFQISTTNSVNYRVGVILSQEDDNIYFTSGAGVGSLIENPGETFDPSDSSTYTFTNTAILIPTNDESTCIAELGQNLLIGGRRGYVYFLDKVSPGFNNIMNIPDTFTTAIVPANQNAYIFSGTRGYIYITNGSGIDTYKKYPDYLTGVTNPYIRWKDANFIRNQLVFSISAVTNAGVSLTTVGGVWAIDLTTDALRLINKTTFTGYSASVPMVVEYPISNSDINYQMTPGNSMIVGWFSGSTYGLDIGSSNPYTNYESYLDTEFIPVGTFLDPFSPSQIEWKTSTPLVSGEGVKVSYRLNITDSFTQIGESTTAGSLSDLYQANFQKAQWVQFRVNTKSTSSSPSYTRLTEMRVRDYPSGKNA